MVCYLQAIIVPLEAPLRLKYNVLSECTAQCSRLSLRLAVMGITFPRLADHLVNLVLQAFIANHRTSLQEILHLCCSRVLWDITVPMEQVGFIYIFFYIFNFNLTVTLCCVRS